MFLLFGSQGPPRDAKNRWAGAGGLLAKRAFRLIPCREKDFSSQQLESTLWSCYLKANIWWLGHWAQGCGHDPSPPGTSVVPAEGGDYKEVWGRSTPGRGLGWNDAGFCALHKCPSPIAL